ncbi:hypothetical protein LIER_12656 [Lithospermum erythrorhizon]|uniref:Reverse transcriptase domain-containing protein n=1 Tax=Lithospermum erythrorhizon TaxID=34254 RepID=A0AAV3PUP1_LITER
MAEKGRGKCPMKDTRRRSLEPKRQSSLDRIWVPDRGYSWANLPRGGAFSHLEGDPKKKNEGKSGGSDSGSARRAHAKMDINATTTGARPDFPNLSFSRKDFEGIECSHEDPLVITTVIVNFEVDRMLVDTQIFVDILLLDVYPKLGMSRAEIRPVAIPLVGFTDVIRELLFPTWMANEVLVPKPNGTWMCIDFTSINKACPKDYYPLPNIDRLIDSSAGYKEVDFLDTFRGYHKIFMAEEDVEKTGLITEYGIYCRKEMAFGLRNVGATYQWMVNRVFSTEISRNMKIYVYDMLIKSRKAEDHKANLRESLKNLRRNKLRLNLNKCVFGVNLGKFLRFISRAGDRSLPFFKAIKKAKEFEWTSDLSNRSRNSSNTSSSPLLAGPVAGDVLQLYLVVS